MNRLLRYALLLAFSTAVMAACRNSSPPGQQVPATVMSYNIRYDNPGDGPNRWDLRRERLANQVRLHRPDFLGVQEALHHQMEWLDDELETMDWIGVGRDDGAQEGEYSAIFYNRERFELVAGSDSTLWLSPTPGVVGSRGWDAALPRILTFGTFRERESGREIMVFNTHFDHRGDTARAESARLIAETVRKLSNSQNDPDSSEPGRGGSSSDLSATYSGNPMPVVVTGDFNTPPESESYRELTGGELRDAFRASELPHVGPLFTFDGFEVRGSENPQRIDYIFVNEEVTVRTHTILTASRDRRYPSDHLPVVVELAY